MAWNPSLDRKRTLMTQATDSSTTALDAEERAELERLRAEGAGRGPTDTASRAGRGRRTAAIVLMLLAALLGPLSALATLTRPTIGAVGVRPRYDLRRELVRAIGPPFGGRPGRAGGDLPPHHRRRLRGPAGRGAHHPHPRGGGRATAGRWRDPGPSRRPHDVRGADLQRHPRVHGAAGHPARRLADVRGRLGRREPGGARQPRGRPDRGDRDRGGDRE